MDIFCSFLIVIFLIKLLLTAGVRPNAPLLSRFEIERRKKEPAVLVDLLRLAHNIDVRSLLLVAVQLDIILIIIFLYVGFGLFWALFAGIFLSIFYARIAQISLFRKYAQKYYDRFEKNILHFIQKNTGIFSAIRAADIAKQPELELHSKDELYDLVQRATHVLRAEEKKLILHGLVFEKKKVQEIMTPRSVINAVSKDEILGPQLLDELYKTGNTRFPVYNTDIDHIEGILYTHDLLNVQNDSLRADTAMQKKVYYILDSQNLEHALAAFLRTHHHLFIVINEFRETVGIITLEDTIEALLGRKIIDEFDIHDDLRVVAARNPHANSTTKLRQNI